MSTPEAVLSNTLWATWERGPWLRSKHWDLTFLTFSGVLVIIPLFLYELIGTSATFVNLFIAGVIGGPHMYATFFRTVLDEPFRQRYRWLLLSSVAIPVLVAIGAVWHFRLLVTLFFFWASVHVLHQIAYILECYDRKQQGKLQCWSRCIDYAVVFSSLYPMATYHFIHDNFTIGTTLLLFPSFLKTPLIVYLATGFFVLALLAFIAKTLVEVRLGTVHYPKILLMTVTIGLALLITSYSGHKLEIAFQGFNTWHSFQYLALTWYISTLRQQHGEIASPWVQRLSRPGHFGVFYGVNVALTFGALVLIGMVFWLSGLSFEHSYYIVVLSFLLMHYYHDHVLFTRFADLVRA